MTSPEVLLYSRYGRTGATPVTEPMLTIQPAPCLRMCGIAALVSTNGVRR